MLFREHHHSGRVAIDVCRCWIFHFADAVVKDQPAVPRQDWRSATADFKSLQGDAGVASR